MLFSGFFFVFNFFLRFSVIRDFPRLSHRSSARKVILVFLFIEEGVMIHFCLTVASNSAKLYLTFVTLQFREKLMTRKFGCAKHWITTKKSYFGFVHATRNSRIFSVVKKCGKIFFSRFHHLSLTQTFTTKLYLVHRQNLNENHWKKGVVFCIF